MSIEVFTTATPELVIDAAVPEVIETAGTVEVHDTSTETLTEQTESLSVVVEVAQSTVTDRWVEATVIESAMQGPPGPAGPAGTSTSYPAKHLTYTDGEVSEVLLYSDAAATQLAERRVITRAGGNVTGITYFDGAGVTLHTRTFTYALDGTLSGIVDN